MKSLKGREVISQVTAFKSPKADKNGKPVFIGSHDGKGFTMSEEQYGDWRNGNISELTLVESTYVATTDNENRGIKIGDKVNCWSVGGYLPYSQAIGIAQNELKLDLATKELMKAVTVNAGNVEELVG